MAQLFNSQPVIGIKLLADGTKLFNNQPVIGIRAAGAAAFEGNHRVRLVQVVADGVLRYNGAAVVGAVQITDGRKLYNNQPVIPVGGLDLGFLFAAGQDGFLAGGFDPASGRLFQDPAGVTPANTASQPVGLVRRLRGTVDPSQATAGSKPFVARWPKTGVRNKLTQSVVSTVNGGWTNQSGTLTQLAGNYLGKFPGVRVASAGQTWQRIEPASNQRQNVLAGQPVSVVAFVTAGTSPKARLTLRNGTAAMESQVDLTLATGVANIVSQSAGNVTNLTVTSLAEGVWQIGCTVTFLADANFAIGLGPGSSVIGEDVIALGAQVEIAAAPSPYQHSLGVNDVTEPGVADQWHLSNDGNDAMPIVLPAGTYGLASLDISKAATITTINSDGITPIDTLRHARLIDVALRRGAFTAFEQSAIQSHWARIAA